MLTRQDRTIADCLDLFDLIRPLRLRHVGFKDIGVDARTLEALTKAIRGTGATRIYGSGQHDARGLPKFRENCRWPGIDRPYSAVPMWRAYARLFATSTEYYPFPGRPGHPTKAG